MHRRDALVRVNEVGGIPGTDFLSRKNWGDGSPGWGLPADRFSSRFEKTVPLKSVAFTGSALTKTTGPECISMTNS